MKKISLLAITFCLILNSCSSDNDYLNKKDIPAQDEQSTKEQESKELEKLFNEISALSVNGECTGDWNFVAVGSQSCGGPEKYIPYSSKINTTNFLEKVNTYNLKQKDFNDKWNISSTCNVVPKPVSVGCVEGKPTLLYESDKIEEKENLKKMYDEIIKLSNNTTSACSGNWHFIALGTNPCGGPDEYIPYSLKINTTDFLSKVSSYNTLKGEFNIKWKISSTCDIVPKPESAKCLNGKVILLYESDRITERENLKKMHDEIVELSRSTKSCTGEWSFTAIGSKPCGGTENYIPYSLQINTTDFLNKVNIYNSKVMEFNEKWDINSNCDIVPKPKSVDCVNEKATLIY